MLCLLTASLLGASEPPLLDIDPAPPPPEVTVVEVPASRTLPDAIRTLIQTAIEEHDEAALAAIVKMARKAFPDSHGGVTAETAAHDTQAAARAKSDEAARLARLANPNPFANWKGEVELGASRATGNTDNLALYASAKAEREGLHWSHSFNARADFQTTNKATTTERILAAWQPRYKIEDEFYAYGLGQFEHDRFLGVGSRETLAAGIGYGVIRRPNIKLDFEGGPALRHTDFIGEQQTTTVAGRASIKFSWKISPNLQIAQDASTFVERDNNNASATTSLETHLLGALKARFSYNLQYEQNAPDGRNPIDTLSRATLVYGF